LNPNSEVYFAALKQSNGSARYWSMAGSAILEIDTALLKVICSGECRL
jgi:hypothetical protein